MNYFQNKIITSNELKILRGSEGNTFQKRLSYYLKNGKLIKIRKGIYVFEEEISRLGLYEYYKIANNIYFPSYISYETVLQSKGVIFQDYNTIFLAGPYKKEINIEFLDLDIVFFRHKKQLFLNPIGLISKDGYNIACKERAICDILLRSGNYYFDNLENVDWILLKQIGEFYGQYNKRVYKNILDLIKKNAKS